MNFCLVKDVDLYVLKHAPATSLKPASSDLCKDMTAFFDEGKFTDVTLVHADGEARAHRLMLQARSPVLQCMFATNMKENIEGKMDMSDSSGEAVAAFLRYIYGHEVDSSLSLQVMQELTNLATKYELPALLDRCCQYLIAGLGPETMASILLCAHRFDLDIVKDAALSFSTRDRDVLAAVQDAPEFLQFPKDLVVELLQASVGKRQKKDGQMKPNAANSEAA